jgi:hypothetical protein
VTAFGFAREPEVKNGLWKLLNQVEENTGVLLNVPIPPGCLFDRKKVKSVESPVIRLGGWATTNMILESRSESR